MSDHMIYEEDGLSITEPRLAYPGAAYEQIFILMKADLSSACLMVFPTRLPHIRSFIEQMRAGMNALENWCDDREIEQQRAEEISRDEDADELAHQREVYNAQR